jgi:hypothetical protein
LLPITRFTLVGRRSYSCKCRVPQVMSMNVPAIFAARGCYGLGTISAEPLKTSQNAHFFIDGRGWIEFETCFGYSNAIFQFFDFKNLPTTPMMMMMMMIRWEEESKLNQAPRNRCGAHAPFRRQPRRALV